MKNKTFKALVFSAIGFAVCVVMLTGTTFALFHNQADSTSNIVKTANYNNVSIQWSNAYNGPWSDLAGEHTLYNDVPLAPGENTEIRFLKITNSNSYKVKANLSIKATGGSESVLDLYFDDAATSSTNVDSVLGGHAQDLYNTTGIDVLTNQEISENGGTHYVALVIKLPEDTDSEPNTSITFDVLAGASATTN